MFVCLCLFLQGLAEAMVNVYREAMRVFLPTPAKSHYTFSLRDITRVFQGIVMVPAKRMPDPEKLGRLWAHETYRVFYDRYVWREKKKHLSNFLPLHNVTEFFLLP